MGFAKGQRVRHPAKPEWGVGQVLEHSSSSSVRVFFVGAGEKQLSLEYVNLILVEGQEAAHPVLDNLKLVHTGGGSRYLSLPHAIDRFLELYPQGFYGDKYLEEERNYKVKAHDIACDVLSNRALTQLIAEVQ